ncbi:hypothetical protein BDC45DRAFT_529772 [Circinella umbellata]|nr:hypothetical protein BDC45DRAFT_529772 [Circinella umbellata]
MTTTAANNDSVEEATLNFLHTIGDQGSVQETRLKNEMIDVMAAEQQPHLREALMDVILRTTNKEVLEALATAPKACRIYHEWIKEALKETDWLTIGKMLKVLDHLPLETSTLVEYKLGKAVNIVQRKAASHDRGEMSSEARQVMNKWSEQHKTAKSTTPANGDLNTEKRKSPPTSANNPTKKTPRLAISDERPVKSKPQAKTDMNFFKMFTSNNNNNGTRKPPPTGLRREESFILEASDSSNSPSPQALLSPTSSSSSYVTASSYGFPVTSSSTTNINGSGTSLKSTDKTKRSGKRVLFNDQALVKVCYYSKHNWRISDKPHEVLDDEDHERDSEVQHFENSNNSTTFPHLNKQQQSKNLNNWHRAPARLLLNHECKHAGEVQSEEAILQRKREAVTPPVLYKNDYEIPYTPEEPDDFGSNIDETNVKVIPLEDLACYDQEEDNNGGLIAVDHTHEQQQQQQQQQRYYYNDHLNNDYSDNNNNNTASAVPVSVPATTISSTPSTTNILPASLPNVDFPQLQALLNGVFSSSTSPTSIPSQPQSQSQHSLPPQSSYTSSYQQQQQQIPTGRSSNYMNSRGENYAAFSAPSSSHHRGGGNHYHPSAPSSTATKKDKLNRRRGGRKGPALCRYYKLKDGCRRENCKFSHDL